MKRVLVGSLSNMMMLAGVLGIAAASYMKFNSESISFPSAKISSSISYEKDTPKFQPLKNEAIDSFKGASKPSINSTPKFVPSVKPKFVPDAKSKSVPSVKPKFVPDVKPKAVPSVKLNPSQKFKSAIAFVLRHEGGLADDKSDRGGITKYGISYRYLHSVAAHQPQIRSELSLKHGAQVTPSTIRNLTLKQAIEIYHIQWWRKFHFGSLNSPAIATKAFDFSVNMGEKPAIKLLQIAAKEETGRPIQVNGQLDNQTIRYINSLNKTQLHQLLYTYESVIRHHYIEIAKAHPNDRKFLPGWLHRADDNSYSSTVI